jgi:hypothetical protein
VVFLNKVDMVDDPELLELVEMEGETLQWDETTWDVWVCPHHQTEWVGRGVGLSKSHRAGSLL